MVDCVSAQEGLHIPAPTDDNRIELGDHLAPANDREVLAAMFHGIKELGEVPSCGRGAHLSHPIRLSDVELGGQAPLKADGRLDVLLRQS